MAVRSATPYTPAMGSTTQREVPGSGDTIVVIQTLASNIYILVAPAGLLASLNIQLPASGAFDGQSICIAFTQPITVLGLTGAPVIGALTSIAANGFARYAWSNKNNSWNRVG